LYKKRAVYLSVGLLVLPLVSAGAEPGTVAVSPLQLTLEQLPQRCPALPASLDAPAQAVLQGFYRQQQFTQAWSSTGRLGALLVQLEQLADDGLNPAGYQLASVRRFALQPPAVTQQAQCHDILTSHVYLQALQHLQRGRLQQAKVEPFWQAQSAALVPAAATDALLGLAVAGLHDLPTAFQRARPALAHYQALRRTYAQLRQQPLATWSALASGPLLRPDMQDARVPALTQRLVSEGYLPATATSVDNRYDSQQVAALKTFQQAHALQTDGIVGAATLAALNASPAARREQLRVNLERFRWLGQNLEATSLLINVAAAQLTYYQAGVPVWQTRTQVGRPQRPTPLLKSQITRLTLNPNWSVPPTIFWEDKLPEIRRDLGFLREHQMQIFDRDGKRLDADQVDWDNPGYIQLRQRAGPKNPLGQVALRFDNPYAVYLHDTPSQQLFSKAPRAFSSGCVRIEQALYLTEQLLTADERERANSLLASGKTHEFRLSNPMPLLLSYWTAEVDSAGHLLYAPDIYGRDAALLAALDSAKL
jgi:murein L,D-transpeptidase YcbB/YkuD